MGLDITAHGKIKKIDAVFDADGEPIDPVTREEISYNFRAYLNPDFPGRANDVEDGAVYSSDKIFCLCAGSYGGYNRWREQLAELAGWPSRDLEQYGTFRKSHCVSCWGGELGPFAELINFSDCEGVIGCEISKKLALDFAEHQSKADMHEDKRFAAKYAEWRSAFELASDDGCVEFH